jgi:predicted nuclease of restriction endonuclease-like (RecB) superfamily
LTQLKKDLAEQHAITGSAVLPNLDTDESWQQKFSEIRAAYEDQLNRVRDGLIGGGN